MALPAEQEALAADPGTDARTLAELAHAEPELWPLIAVHPNVEPALVEWMRRNGLPATPPVTSAASGATEAPAAAAAAGRAPTSLLERMSRRAKIVTGTGVLAGVVAVALIAALVVAPQQRAAKAADQARRAAVTAFASETAACTAANKDMTAAQDGAKRAAATDPATMQDPTLLDKLAGVVKDAQGVTACTAPAQAGDTATIQHQADDLHKAATTVQGAANILADEVAAVTGSVQDKKNVAAAAAKAASDAAKAASDAATAAALADQQAKDAAATAARTWQFTSNDGYTFTVSLQVGTPVTDDTFTHPPAGADSCNTTAIGNQVKCETTNLAAICSDFDATKMIAIPVTATFTATTQGFDTPLTGDFAIRANGTYHGPDVTAPNQVELAAFYSDGGQCRKPDGSGVGPTTGVSWPTPVKAGTTATHHFDVILQKWRTPAAPTGDTALLDYLTVTLGNSTVSGSTTTYTPDSYKALTLNGAIVGG